MFIGFLAKLADPIAGPVTAHLPGPIPVSSRTSRRAARSRRQVLADRRARRLA
jgi:hypothetical protein